MTNNYKYKIKYTKDINNSELLLEVGFSSQEFSNVDLIKDVVQQLEQINKNQEIFTDINILKINGPISIPLAYIFAHEFQHYFNVIAVCDPRLNSFIVTHSYNEDYQIGDSLNKTTNEKHSLILSPQKSDAFSCNLDDNTLNINCKLGIIRGDILAKECAEAIDQLIENQQLKGGNLLKIKGKASIIVSFIIAHKLAHLYANIAVWDPKLDDYVITLRHGGEYAEGELLNHNSAVNNTYKIVICGHANRGKTVLRDALKEVLNKHIPNNNYFVQSGCPDGDGAWFNDTYKNYPDLAKKLKEEYKASFTIDFAENKAKIFRCINTPLLIFDVGGKTTIDNQLTPENKIIMSEATHAIIVGGNDDEINIWRNSCQGLNIPVIAEITSVIGKGNDLIIESEYPLFKAVIHQLERASQLNQSIGISNLAKFLADYLIFGKIP